MEKAIQIKYSCAQCGVYRRVVTVVARKDEDVVAWMDTAAAACSRDHDQRSPQCHITKFTELLVPVGAGKVGG